MPFEVTADLLKDVLLIDLEKRYYKLTHYPRASGDIQDTLGALEHIDDIPQAMEDV